MSSVSLEEILEMDKRELIEYITGESINRGMSFDLDMLEDLKKLELYDYIADNLEPQWQAELHSECQQTLGHNIFGAETEEELEEAFEHAACRNIE